MTNKSSLAILDEFLNKKNISINTVKYLKKYIPKSKDFVILPENIIEQIIVDAFEGHREIVKEISQKITNDFQVYLGRIQKVQLKQYLDYQKKSDFQELLRLIGDEITPYSKEIKAICAQNLKKNPQIIENSVKAFLGKLETAINDDNQKRVTDYLIFIYSRLVTKNEERKISLKKLYDDNMDNSSFDGKQKEKFLKFCNNKKNNRDEVIRNFNTKYLNILENGDKKSAIIYLNVSQEIYNNSENKANFYDSLFSFIKNAYDKLENHKTLVIRVGNILSNNINIKWEIYSYLTIYSEKFQKVKERGTHFFPEILCKEFLEHQKNIHLSNDEIKILKKYYRDEIDFNILQKYCKKLDFKNVENIINEFNYIYSGFTFIDCIILKNKKTYPNSKELDFIKNNNELLLLFQKHKKDSRKIPCPVCGSLKISGNSFPEIGIRSWECKNSLCSARSKTNRGKRYSSRTIFMQNARNDEDEKNTISKQLIAKWRRDIVDNPGLNSIYLMIIKYYSSVGKKITGINIEDKKEFKKINKNQKRKSDVLEFDEFVDKVESGLYKKFIEKSDEFEYIKHFIYDKEPKKSKKKSKKITIDGHVVFQGDCRVVLDEIDESITNMVTSPPYYNVREYSQWDNLYQYLKEMYDMALKSSQKLQKGGVFFFNIGDIFDNEKIIVKSKMGEKRIPLGAYIILIFRKAGFELLDNVIWDKGEPQSNRHKNDGNYVPYYQRPANCYEHMFIFKNKGGSLHLNSVQKKNLLKSNIQKFVPVYKIGKGGINTLGHTAPFPEDIPRLSINCFTNPGEIVVDPYLGSGTTIIVSKKEDRKGIGIEMNDEYVKLSEKRISKK